MTLPTVIQDIAGGSVSATLTGFASADFTETRSAQDSLIKVDAYPTGADDWISRSSNTIDDVISGVTLHLHDTSFNGTTYDPIEVNLTPHRSPERQNQHPGHGLQFRRDLHPEQHQV